MSSGMTFSNALVGSIPEKRPFCAVVNAHLRFWPVFFRNVRVALYSQGNKPVQPNRYLSPPSGITETCSWYLPRYARPASAVRPLSTQPEMVRDWTPCYEYYLWLVPQLRRPGVIAPGDGFVTLSPPSATILRLSITPVLNNMPIAITS